MRAGDRTGLGEDLEGVAGGGGLAVAAAQVGLQAPAVAAVEIAVGLEGGENRGLVAAAVPVAVEEGMAAPVQQPGVGIDEGLGGGEVDGHGVTVPPATRPAMDRR